MTEVTLFIIVGALAVAAAVMMLLSDKAVHSALFLIVTMACISFLFLLLNAPFLAMIQITVYAGAIMVLFLFVIMLLGAETIKTGDPGPGKRGYRWFTPLALMLTLALLIAGALVLVQSQIDLTEIPGAQPLLRVVNVVPGAGTVEVTANEEVIASDLAYQASTAFISLPAGAYTLALNYGDRQLTTDVSLEPGSAQTLVAYGVERPVLALIDDDVSAVDDPRSARVRVFNAYSGLEAVSLVDLGSDLVADDTTVILPALAAGELSEPLIRAEGTVDWTVIEPERESIQLAALRDYAIDRDTSDLIILAEERQFDGTLRMTALPISIDAYADFGSPRAIGYSLFTDYMLPFQLLALLLLAAMVGAIVLTHRESESKRRMTARRKVSRPLVAAVAEQVGRDVGERAETDGQGAPALPDVAVDEAETVGN